MSYLAINPSLLPTELWRPYYPESNDGEPLASSISELFFQFNYTRLPKDNILLQLLLRPEVVLIVLGLYVSSKKPVAYLRDVIGIDSKSSLFRNCIAIHNLGLAIFSGIVAYNSWGIVIEHYRTYGFISIYCENVSGNDVATSSALLWKNGLGSWSTIFYVSKYYEFIDTWILVLKKKPASFLQVYHHTGIVFIMWAAVLSQSNWLLFVVLLNSFIHTLMYTYFFIKTISPSTELTAAKYLTTAQITQFFTGIFATFGIFLFGTSCATASSIFALACLHLYGFGLIALFFSFAQRKYKNNKKR